MSRARDLADGTFSGAFAADSPTFVVDAANNRVGVGTASPATALNIGALGVFRMQTGSITMDCTPTPGGIDGFVWNVSAGYYDWAIGGTSRARIDASGNLLVGGTAVESGFSGIPVLSVGANSNGLVTVRRSSTTASSQIIFYNPNGIVGQILTDGSSTTFSTSSDYRLKENVTPLAGAADRLMQIPVCRFNFIADPERTVDGFLAHEVQKFVPECVTGTKDQVETVDVTDEDGNVIGTEERPVYQGIDQSKLVPLLAAALQEALADIATLKAEVAALKGSA